MAGSFPSSSLELPSTRSTSIDCAASASAEGEEAELKEKEEAAESSNFGCSGSESVEEEEREAVGEGTAGDWRGSSVELSWSTGGEEEEEEAEEEEEQEDEVEEEEAVTAELSVFVSLRCSMARRMQGSGGADKRRSTVGAFERLHSGEK